MSDKRKQSSSSSSDSSDYDREKKKLKKLKKEAKKKLKQEHKLEKKLIKKEKKRQKKEKKSAKAKSKVREKKCEKAESLSKEDSPIEEDVSIGPSLDELATPKMKAPMTKEEWEKQQAVIKRVYDEETGRYRLIKGRGEVLEECVSRERHKAINKQATQGDGKYFQSTMASKLHNSL